MNSSSSLRLVTPSSSCIIHPQRGGIVSSLHLGGQERLWMPHDFSTQDSSWPGGGLPLCFPFAGRVWGNGQVSQYELASKTMPMPLHGFAYAAKWDILHQTATSATLRLLDSAGTQTIYPFVFELTQEFSLAEKELLIKTMVRCKGPVGSLQSEMPVALGWHPYFLRHQNASGTLSVPAKKYHPVTPSGAAGKIADAGDLGPEPWSVDQPLLKSLILTDLQQDTASLKWQSSSDLQLQFGPNGLLRHVVVWTNQPDQFYCVEPWMSLPDAVATPSGCKWLKSGESLEAWFRIKI